MKYLWSAKNSAFILEGMETQYEERGWDLTDLQQLDDEIVMEFMGEQPAGKMRVTDVDGLPCWVDLPPPTHEEQLAAADSEKQLRIDQTNDYINDKQWPGKAALGRLKGGELAQYNLWLDYLDALEAVDISTAPDISWPTQPEV